MILYIEKVLEIWVVKFNDQLSWLSENSRGRNLKAGPPHREINTLISRDRHVVGTTLRHLYASDWSTNLSLTVRAPPGCHNRPWTRLPDVPSHLDRESWARSLKAINTATIVHAGRKNARRHGNVVFMRNIEAIFCPTLLALTFYSNLIIPSRLFLLISFLLFLQFLFISQYRALTTSSIILYRY